MLIKRELNDFHHVFIIFSFLKSKVKGAYCILKMENIPNFK